MNSMLLGVGIANSLVSIVGLLFIAFLLRGKRQ